MKNIHDIISGKELLPGKDDFYEVENFLGTAWNLYYNLYNPENFQDFDNAPAWYDPKDCYEFYETPFCNSQVIEISGENTSENISLLTHMYEHTSEIESSIISYIVNYTFHDGGAYAEGKYFYFAKKTIEKSENRVFQNEADFIKKCICVSHISLGDDGKSWTIVIRCAWDIEHGIELHFNKDSLVSVE